MPGLPTADLLIGRTEGGPACITRFDFFYALELAEHCLGAPEASATERGYFLVDRDHETIDPVCVFFSMSSGI